MRKRNRLSELSELLLEDRTVPADFSNTNPITIADFGPASPYPSSITVSGLTGQQITNVKVIFHGLTHDSPEDIDAMLIAPNGTKIYLMSDAGGGTGNPVSGVVLTFSDTGGTMPAGQISTGTYKPTNLDQGDPDTIPGAPSGTLITTLAGFNGLDPNGVWELRIHDDTGAFTSGSIAGGWTLQIDSRVNTPPVATNDSYTIDEDTQLITNIGTSPFGVLHNDTDGENDPLTAQLVNGPSHGTLVFNTNGTFTYTPRANYNGTDSFTYRASDGIALSNVATVTINLTPINDVPLSNNDTLTIQNGAPQTIHKSVLVDNDLDPDLTYRSTIYFTDFEGLATQPFSAGGVSNGGAGADGTDWGELPVGWVRDNASTPSTGAAAYFGWHAMDIDSWISQQGDQDRAAFTRGGVGARGTVMVADGDAYDDFVNIDPDLMDTFLTTPVIPLNGINQDSLTLEFDSSYRPEAAGQIARLYVSFDGGTFTKILEYTPGNTPGGTGSLARANEHLTIDLHNPFNAKTVQIRWGYEDAGNDWWWAIDNVKLTGDKTDPDQHTIEIMSQPDQGSVALDANGAVVYTPPTTSFTGTTSFTYRLNDGVTTGNTATVDLTVNANNAAPVAVNDTYTTVQAVPLKIHFDRSVIRNDSDTDLNGGNGIPGVVPPLNAGLKATLVSGPTAAQGTLSFKPDGSFLFTPNTAFIGNATFTYKLSDGTTESNTATVTITVTQINTVPPVANNDSYSVNNNSTLTVSAATGVLANDTDADGNPLTAVATRGPNNLVIGPDHGTLTLNADGSFIYVPRPFFNGTDRFTYRAFDGAFNSNLATVTITVNAVNVAPQANPDRYFTTPGTPLTVTSPGVLANDRDDGPNVQLFLETFEGLTLQPWNTGTTSSGDGTDWTDALPTNWVRDNTTTPPPASSSAAGAEFFGWHAMDIDSWIAQQGNQARSDFTRGGAGLHSTVLVADGDAYDDFVNIDTNRMNTLLTTPSINLAGILPNSLELHFDSSFRPEAPPPGNQRGLVQVSYDNGTTWIDLLDLNTANSGGAGSRQRTNEHIVLDAFNPAGATTAKFRFSYLEAGNDWWWAIDNVEAIGSTPNSGASLTAQLVTAPPAEQGTVTLNADGSFTFTPAAGFTGLSTFTYQTNDGVHTSTPTTVKVQVGAQARVQVDDGSGQRSMVRKLVVTFSGQATFAGAAAAAFELKDANNVAVPFQATVDNIGGNTVVTLTFTGGTLVGGSLNDGNYTLTVLSNQVTIDGKQLDGNGDGTPGGNLVLQFHRLFGDGNGDRTVDGTDFADFGNAFGLSVGDAGFLSAFDFDANGTIDGTDFGEFGNRFGTSI